MLFWLSYIIRHQWSMVRLFLGEQHRTWHPQMAFIQTNDSQIPNDMYCLSPLSPYLSVHGHYGLRDALHGLSPLSPYLSVHGHHGLGDALHGLSTLSPYLSVHGHHGLGDALHGLSHGVVGLEGLDLQ